MNLGRVSSLTVWLLAVSAASALCACASASAAKASPCTLPIEVALEASARLNPDLDGTPLPTVVRLYQLAALERMEQADFVELWDHPTEVLANDALVARELTLFPGHAQRVQVELRPEVRFLAAMAVVRQPTGTQWRASMPLPESARLCAAYAASGAPSPALTFQFDGYRTEGNSRLLAHEGNAPLPPDVAPEAVQ
jgi:type VI secretion system protein VasD